MVKKANHVNYSKQEASKQGDANTTQTQTQIKLLY